MHKENARKVWPCRNFETPHGQPSYRMSRDGGQEEGFEKVSRMVSGKDRNVVSLSSLTLPPDVTQFVSVEKGMVVTSSVLVAEKFEVEHFHLLRLIDELIAEEEIVCHRQVGASTSGCTSDECFDCLKHTYLDTQGKKRPMYLLTESGFMLLAMSSKSEGAKRWRRQFVNAFQKLKTLLLNEANRRLRALTKPQESVCVPVYNLYNKTIYTILAPVKNYSEQQRLILRKANAVAHAKSVIANTKKWEKEFLPSPLFDFIPVIDIEPGDDGALKEDVFASDLKMGKMPRLPPEAFRRSDYRLNRIKRKL